MKALIKRFILNGIDENIEDVQIKEKMVIFAIFLFIFIIIDQTYNLIMFNLDDNLTSLVIGMITSLFAIIFWFLKGKVKIYYMLFGLSFFMPFYILFAYLFAMVNFPSYSGTITHNIVPAVYFVILLCVQLAVIPFNKKLILISAVILNITCFLMFLPLYNYLMGIEDTSVIIDSNNIIIFSTFLYVIAIVSFVLYYFLRRKTKIIKLISDEKETFEERYNKENFIATRLEKKNKLLEYKLAHYRNNIEHKDEEIELEKNILNELHEDKIDKLLETKENEKNDIINQHQSEIENYEAEIEKIKIAYKEIEKKAESNTSEFVMKQLLEIKKISETIDQLLPIMGKRPKEDLIKIIHHVNSVLKSANNSIDEFTKLQNSKIEECIRFPKLMRKIVDQNINVFTQKNIVYQNFIKIDNDRLLMMSTNAFTVVLKNMISIAVLKTAQNESMVIKADIKDVVLNISMIFEKVDKKHIANSDETISSSINDQLTNNNELINQFCLLYEGKYQEEISAHNGKISLSFPI